MMTDARRGRFDVVLVWASDRIARSVKHFLEVLDELNRLNIEFISFRENIDTGGPLGRAIVVIIGAIAELERNLIVERVRAGMRRARLEGPHIGRNPLALDHEAIQRDRCQGQSLRQIARGHRISTATVQRVLQQARRNHSGASCMIDESAAVLPLWMLISAAFGFMVGEALGGQARVRKYLEQANDDLREQLQEARPSAPDIQQELRQQRRVINDIHKRIAAVTKGLQKPTS